MAKNSYREPKLPSPSIVESVYCSRLCFKFFIHPFRRFFPVAGGSTKFRGMFMRWCDVVCIALTRVHDTTDMVDSTLSMPKRYHVCCNAPSYGLTTYPQTLAFSWIF